MEKEHTPMTNRFAQMDCFILAGGQNNPQKDFEPEGDLTRLESGYRRYAALFERVRLVLKADQAVERYLNYPHVCDDDPRSSAAVGLATALRNSRSEAVFVGSSEIRDFPLDLVVDLVNSYDNELFLGYRVGDQPQVVFGICHRRLAERLQDMTELSRQKLEQLLSECGRLLPMPKSVTEHPAR
jgi:molybdopterin-guanine dinucleotide biosynthesis protein A